MALTPPPSRTEPTRSSISGSMTTTTWSATPGRLDQSGERAVLHPVEPDVVPAAPVPEDDPVHVEPGHRGHARGVRPRPGALGEAAHPHHHRTGAGVGRIGRRHRGTQPITMVVSMPAFLCTYCFWKSPRSCMAKNDARLGYRTIAMRSHATSSATWAITSPNSGTVAPRSARMAVGA